ncbi:MAG: radical SAM protein [Anaerovoracaceae bacterium]|jgi:pyruvate formate lyase activating enzyme
MRGNYGRLTSIALDPIEKKPLAMFHPGSKILSIGSYGCNLKCPWCQNSSISMSGGSDVPTVDVSPGQLADLAQEAKEKHGSLGVAYTYNEPLVGWRYVRDAGRLIRGRGMLNVLVTNGCWDDPVIDEVLPYMDAMNIDLKGFRPEIYAAIGGNLEKVKHFITRCAGACHVEVTSLIVPGVNDSEEDMEQEAVWLAGIDPRLPLHISRFFPAHLMRNTMPTDIGLMKRMLAIAGEHLENVFAGNM